MSGFLERYRQGEYQEVWDELDALGAGVRERLVYSEALAVAHETMQRVRHNIEVVISTQLYNDVHPLVHLHSPLSLRSEKGACPLLHPHIPRHRSCRFGPGHRE